MCPLVWITDRVRSAGISFGPPTRRHLTMRKRRCVAARVSITSMGSSCMCSPPRCSNILVPLPNSTGTRWTEISSTRPAAMYCWPMLAPPITLDDLLPGGLRLLERALDAVGDEGVDAPFGALGGRVVGDDEHRTTSGARRPVRPPPRSRVVVGRSAGDDRSQSFDGILE